MTDRRFDAAMLDRLRRERRVRIETRRHAGGPVHRTTIWIVVDDAGHALIRSWRGAGARWYREATGGQSAALIVGRDAIPVSIVHATDAARVASCSRELESKYAGDPATREMVAEEVLDTTLEVMPATAA
jgi:hypothetical protein